MVVDWLILEDVDRIGTVDKKATANHSGLMLCSESQSRMEVEQNILGDYLALPFSHTTPTHCHAPRPVAKDVISQSDCDYFAFSDWTNERAITVHFRRPGTYAVLIAKLSMRLLHRLIETI